MRVAREAAAYTESTLHNRLTGFSSLEEAYRLKLDQQGDSK